MKNCIYKREKDENRFRKATLYTMSQVSQFIKRSLSKPEIYPLFGILGAALAGGGYMAFHQAHSPDVVWNHKTNSEPWQHVKDGEQVKLATVNQKYDGKYTRKQW